MYIDGKSKGGSLASTILDSPILRRAVEAENGTTNSIQSNTFTSHTIKKGILWQQRDRLFSRWKERFFVLTSDYLNCFRKATDSGPDRISDMGPFLFKIKLVDVDRVEWMNKKSYSVIILHLTQGRLLLRSAHDLEDWFESLEEFRVKSRKRREMLRMSHDSYLRDRENDEMTSTYNSGHEDWLLARNRIARLQRDHIADSSVDIPSMATSITTGSRSGDEDDRWPNSSRQRHSLLTNIDLNALNSPPPSVPPSLRGRTPYKQNSDIFFMAPGQRASIAGTGTGIGNDGTQLSYLRHRNVNDTNGTSSSFRVPNMLQTTRGTANRYSYAEEKIPNDMIYSTYDARLKSITNTPS